MKGCTGYSEEKIFSVVWVWLFSGAPPSMLLLKHSTLNWLIRQL